MALLAPVLRFPDYLGLQGTDGLASLQNHLPSPLSDISPDVLFSVLLSFSFIILLGFASLALRKTPGSALATPNAASSSFKRSKAREVPNVVLIGPSGVGKTSLFSALAFDSVPSVHPSQRESETVLSISAKGTNELDQPRKRNVHLIDTPGHPRIKDRIIEEHIKDADVIVFCVDAKEVLRGSVSAGQAKDSNIVEAVDHLHAALTLLAKLRRDAKTRPPNLLFLFTRADLSPHLSNISLSSINADDTKRRSILLSRAQATLESELSKRRAGMGLGAKRSTKVGGMAKVTGGEGGDGFMKTIKTLLGWRSASKVEVEDDEEEGEPEDYVVERQTEKGSVTSNSVSLTKLNNNIIFGGSATFAFSMLGTERGWTERNLEGLQELKRILVEV